jgi:YVTN family beta-propeller protein
MAQATTRLKFVTTVYIPAMRDPYSAAKAIGTAEYLADGRVELSVGVGWCEEEFTLMGQRFDRRGRRTDEMLELFRALWEAGWLSDMAVSPDGSHIYVTNFKDSTVAVVNANTGAIDNTVAIPTDFAGRGAPMRIAFSPNGDHVYVVDQQGTVSEVSFADTAVNV